MFSSHPALSAGSRAPINAYVRTGIETRAVDADPHQLVVMLFDGLFESLAQARGAIRSGDAAAKGRAIGRAVRIVDEGLRGALDLSHGGTLAEDLHDLYAYVALRLTRANLVGDEAAVDECVALVEPVRTAWMSIRPADAAVA
jgi:flagellar secretion chaperone FliS